MKIIKSIALGALLCFSALSCSDLKEIKSDINDIKNRMDALEKQVDAINANISALQSLAQSGSIKSVIEQDGKYTITLNNGEVLTINQGSLGVGTAPKMSISDDGYWMVDYSDGTGAQYVLQDGQKVPAAGQDGATPIFSVDDEGYWCVSYDNGVTVSRVLDVKGNPVKAIIGETSGDSYFANIEYNGDSFTLTLRNGRQYVIPIRSDFLCQIVSDGKLQLFKHGESRNYTVNMEGVDCFYIIKPQGWEAALIESGELQVAAPTSLTKSTLADSQTDLCLVGINSQGISTVSKIHVWIEGQERQVLPLATASYVTASSSSLTFSVHTEECTDWKYVCQLSSMAEPTARYIQKNGTVGESETVTIDRLNELSEYTLYVVPFNGSQPGEVAKASGTTTEIYDRYSAYMSGSSILVEGIEFNRSTHGDPQLVQATTENFQFKPDAQVVFLDTPTGTSLQMRDSWVVTDKNKIIISRYSDRKAKVYSRTANAAIQLKQGLVLKDLDMDLNEHNKYFMNGAAGATVPFLYVCGCTIRLNNSFVRFTDSGNVIESLKFISNNIRFDGPLTELSEDENPFIYNLNSTKLDLWKDCVFKDNIFFSEQPRIVRLTLVNSTTSVNGSDENVVVENNTFVQVHGRQCYFTLHHAQNISFRRNLIWFDQTFYKNPMKSIYIFFFRNDGGNADRTAWDALDNIIYMPGTTSAYHRIASNGSKLLPVSQNMDVVREDPFGYMNGDTWTFIKRSKYEDYGAKR